MHNMHMPRPAGALCLSVKSTGNTNARMASCRRVERNVVVELRRLGRDWR